MTRRVAVYCKGNRRQDIYHQTIKIANELRQAGIRDVRVLPTRAEIQTSCVKIFIVNNNPEKLKKLQIEERFGFPNTSFQSGGLINYILEEERKEK